MIRSTTEIENEMLVALEGFLKERFNIKLYPSDCRPFDSREEDAVLTVSNVSANQIQRGRARLNIFVNDIDNSSGRLVPNKGRLLELSKIDEEVVRILNEKTTDYYFSLFLATDTIAEPKTAQHFVNINIEFKVTTF